jgi:2-polyprenyl-6-methoxyphenol hydroxylase-like FAD-dependent oxidoreductase
MQEYHTEVLIIGAGPTGLFTAAELARHGVLARIIEKDIKPHTQTRATEIQPATLELLHRAGLAEQFIESSLPMLGLRVLDRNMEEAFVFSIPSADSPYSSTRSMPQWRTEQILGDHLATLGVEVERGITAHEITFSDSGVHVECADRDGESFMIHADYLVGAGGAHSPSRGALQESLAGITYPRRYLVADVATSGARCEGHLISVVITTTGMVMTIELPGGRSLLLTDLLDGEFTPVHPTIDDARRAIAVHLQKPFELSDLRWASVYRMHRRMSPRFSHGRCLLAGDAAHICSPLGGEGLNAGISDGASLAWQLAAVLRRGGKPLLLEAYELERKEVARQVLTSSDAMHDFYYDVLVNTVVQDMPLTDPGADPTRKVTSGAMVDILLTESPLLGYHGFYRPHVPVKPGSRFPSRTLLSGSAHHLLVYRDLGEPDTAAFAHRWSHVLEMVEGTSICPVEKSGVPVGGALLVRPDGYIAFQAEQWNPSSQEALDQLLSSQFSLR